MLPNAVLALSEKFPHAVVTMREDISAAIIETAERGELDVLIEVSSFNTSHLDIEPLFLDTFYVAVHQDNPLAKLAEIPISALDGMPFILLEDIHCSRVKSNSIALTSGSYQKSCFRLPK